MHPYLGMSKAGCGFFVTADSRDTAINVCVCVCVFVCVCVCVCV